ncbi:MAG: hypothetical protein KI790_03095 [Cyclobacteriaceae bacterium]|nr:hypothetical protein [Cyclobacteriaceae bacterium HetDA_MAG_MS6]
MKYLKYMLAAVAVIFASHGHAQEDQYTDFKAEVNADYRVFFNEGLYDEQRQHYLSIAFKPEFVQEWQKGRYSLKFTGFGRIDQYDKRRTHFDIRELYWQMVAGNSELSVGIKKIFWGVTESAHLVDIINQTDVVESFDGEEKLGQPMVHYSHLTQIGTFDFFLMPYFRTQVFPGRKGRLRTPFILDGGNFEFESTAEEYRMDVAARYSTYFGPFDLGISHFFGTGRDPIISDLETFEPIYGVIHQTGIDLQATTGPMLWKFEAISRRNDLQDMMAAVAGFEYTFGNVGNSGIDIGVLGEYLYDDRGQLAISSLQKDLFVGSRLAFNDIQDTQFLFGGIFDLEYDTKIFSVESSRRFGQSWTVDVEARIFGEVSEEEFVYLFRDDDFVQLSVSKFF